jgi:hypothetical protein
LILADIQQINRQHSGGKPEAFTMNKQKNIDENTFHGSLASQKKDN